MSESRIRENSFSESYSKTNVDFISLGKPDSPKKLQTSVVLAPKSPVSTGVKPSGIMMAETKPWDTVDEAPLRGPSHVLHLKSGSRSPRSASMGNFDETKLKVVLPEDEAANTTITTEAIASPKTPRKASLNANSKSGSSQKLGLKSIVESDVSVESVHSPNDSTTILEKKLEDMEKFQALVIKENEDLSVELKKYKAAIKELKSQLEDKKLNGESTECSSRSPKHRRASSGPLPNPEENIAKHPLSFVSKNKEIGPSSPPVVEIVPEISSPDETKRKSSLAERLRSTFKFASGSPRSELRRASSGTGVSPTRRQPPPSAPSMTQSKSEEKVWTFLPEEDVVGTIWEELSGEMVLIDFKVFEICTKFVRDGRIVSGLRALMRRMNGSPDELADSIITGDESIWTLENLESLLNCIPSIDLMFDISKYSGSVEVLCNVDRFLLRISFIHDIRERTRLWIFKQNLPREFKYHFEQTSIVDKALKFLNNNNDIRNILKGLLTISNKQSKANSKGFVLSQSLESLRKKSEVGELGVPNSHFIHNLFVFLAEYHPETLEFPTKASILHKAVLIKQDSLRESVLQMDAMMESIPHYALKNDDERKDNLKRELKAIYMEKVPIMLGLRKQTMDLASEALRQSTFLGESFTCWENLFQTFVEIIELMEGVYQDSAARMIVRKVSYNGIPIPLAVEESKEVGATKSGDIAHRHTRGKSVDRSVRRHSSGKASTPSSPTNVVGGS